MRMACAWEYTVRHPVVCATLAQLLNTFGVRKMARGKLLNTRTSNYLELLGNGKIFHAPPYQRDYSWGEEQWEDLSKDIQDLTASSEERHYMGALVVDAI